MLLTVPLDIRNNAKDIVGIEKINKEQSVDLKENETTERINNTLKERVLQADEV